MPKKDHHKRRIKAITFDLWETLLFERDGQSARRSSARCKDMAEALKTVGIKIPAEKVDLALKETVSSLLKVWDTGKDVTHLDQIQLVVKHASGGSVALKEKWVDVLSSAYVSAFFEVSSYLNPDANEVLKWLRSRNKLVGLICNTGVTPAFALRRFLDDQGLGEYFDTMIFSDEVGVRKPDPRIFHLAAERLKAKPSEVVHVGDNLKCDVWGAKNAGFEAVCFSCAMGRDRIAESDPTSLVSISRKLGNLAADEIVPDATITSLSMLKQIIEEQEL